MLKLTKIDGWEAGKLSDVADIVSGGTPSRNIPEYWSPSVIPWATPTDITKDSSIYLNGTSEKISEKGLKHSSANILPTGSVLMTSRATLGFSKIALEPTCTNQGFKSLVPKGGNSGLFLKYWMEFTKKHYADLGTGTTFMEVNKRDTENFPVYLVPHTEQKRIAEILSAVDAQIDISLAERKKLTILLDSLKDILFGNIKRFCHLSNLISDLKSGVSVNSDDVPVHGLGVGVMKTSCIKGGRFIPSENKTVEQRDLTRVKESPKKDRLIISRMNTPALVGESGYVEKDYPSLFIPDRLWQTEHSQTLQHSVKWLSYLLQWSPVFDAIRDKATGTSNSMKNISKQAFLSVQIPIAPFEEQIKQQKIFDELAEKIESLSNQVEKLFAVKRSLMDDLLTGKTRVPS